MKLPEFLIAFFASSAVAVYVVPLTAAAVVALFVVDGQCALRRVRRKQGRAASTIRQRGEKRRKALVRASQTGNLKELGSIVKGQLKAGRGRVPHGTYRQSMEYVKETIGALDFDRLHALHALLSEADVDGVSGRLDAFFQRELEYGYLGRSRKIHFRAHPRAPALRSEVADGPASRSLQAQAEPGQRETGT